MERREDRARDSLERSAKLLFRGSRIGARFPSPIGPKVRVIGAGDENVARGRLFPTSARSERRARPTLHLSREGRDVQLLQEPERGRGGALPSPVRPTLSKDRRVGERMAREPAVELDQNDNRQGARFPDRVPVVQIPDRRGTVVGQDETVGGERAPRRQFGRVHRIFRRRCAALEEARVLEMERHVGVGRGRVEGRLLEMVVLPVRPDGRVYDEQRRRVEEVDRNFATFLDRVLSDRVRGQAPVDPSLPSPPLSHQLREQEREQEEGVAGRAVERSPLLRPIPGRRSSEDQSLQGAHREEVEGRYQDR